MIVERAFVLDGAAPSDRWPFTVPSVAALVGDGLRFTAPVTFLVGENGAGKSTIVEALAEAWGLDVRSGEGGRPYASEVPKSALGRVLKIERTSSAMVGRRQKGFFLRAETATAEFARRSGTFGERFVEASHGESFRAAFDSFFGERGLYVLDEPESALSFTACLALLREFGRLTATGSQVVCSTHSPILTALPGASIVEVGAFGLRPTTWESLDLVRHWRRFLDSPDAYLRYL